MPGITPAPRQKPAASVLGGPRKVRRAQPEASEQRRFIQKWRNAGGAALFCSMATLNGVHLSGLQAKLAKAAGMEKGAPDWMLFEYGSVPTLGARMQFSGLALEFKRPDGGGRLSTEQRRWRRVLLALGWHYVVVETAEEAWEVVEEYLRGIAWQTSDQRADYLPEG